MVKTKIGQTLIHPPTWTCAQNTSNFRFNNCKAPLEILYEVDYSQRHWKALIHQRDRIIRNWKAPKMKVEPPVTGLEMYKSVNANDLSNPKFKAKAPAIIPK